MSDVKETALGYWFPFIAELVCKNSFLEVFGSFLMLTTAFVLLLFNILEKRKKKQHRVQTSQYIEEMREGRNLTSY